MLHRRLIFAALLSLLATSSAWPQGAVLQGGPWAPGRAPMYVGQGSGQAVIQDSGPASGGPVGVGLSELGITARGTGTPPYVSQGSGPFGTNLCAYDAPINNAAGYHFLCFSANATQAGTTGGLISYGAGGIAAQLPLTFCVNGVCSTPGGTVIVTTDNVLYTAPYSQAVQRTQTAVNSERISITDFGAKADSGVSDNGAAITAAGDAAALVGGCVYVPPSSGWYGVSTCRNHAVFDMSGANGNRKLCIGGGGWSQKPFATPTGSWLLPNANFPADCSWIRYSGSDKVTGVSISDVGFGEAGGSLGTPKGLHWLFFDSTDPAAYIQGLLINHVFVGNTANGYSVKVTTGSGATPGGLVDSQIYNSFFMNLNADFLGDHFTAQGNTVGQNATNDSRNIGFAFASCDGCSSPNISFNNIDNTSGAIFYDGADALIADGNEIEQPPFANLNGKQIWVRGTYAVALSSKIHKNNISAANAVNTVSPITVANAQDTSLLANWIFLPTSSTDPHITLTSAAGGTTIRDTSCYIGSSHTYTCTLTNNGAYTGLLDALTLGLSGGLDTKMGRLTAPLNALGLFWNLPSVSGTLSGTASSPIVLNSTTGNITCPSCATTAGAAIPAIAQGDLLYGSAVNTLAALAKSTGTSNFLKNSGTSNNPAWAQPAIADISGWGTGVATALGVNVGTAGSFVVNGGALGTPSSGTLTSATGLPIATGVSGLGTGVATALAVNIGSAGAPVLFNGALGTPSSGVATNLTGTAAGLTAGSATTATTATSATNTAITDDTTTNATMLVTWVTTNTGNLPQKVTSTKLTFNPSTGVLSSTSFTGAGTGLTGTAASLTAGTATNASNGATVAVTTNASFFPLFAASSSNSNQPFNLDTTFTYNPSTDTLTATTFAGNASTATTATTATNATNTAITDDTTTNATMFPTWVTASTGNLPQKTSSTKLTYNPSTGTLSVTALSMAAGAGAFGAGTAATSGQLTTMLLNGGSTAGSYMAWQAGNVTYAFIGDRRAIVGSADDDLLIQTQSGDGFHIQTNGANTDRFVITSAGLVQVPTLGSDAATTDNTVCVGATGTLLKGSGTLGICLGTSGRQFKTAFEPMQAGLEEITQIKLWNYRYRRGFGDDGARMQYGPTAQDVETVLPDLVRRGDNGDPINYDIGALIPISIHAIQQINRRLVALENTR